MKNITIKVTWFLSILLILTTSSVISSQALESRFEKRTKNNAAGLTINGANITSVKFTEFKYDEKKDIQQVKISWKANRGHTFEIYTSIDGVTEYESLRKKSGTSQVLSVPSNAVLKIALRADKYPNYQIALAFESPLQFNNLLFSDLRGCLTNTPTNAADRAQLWQVIQKRKLVGALGIFLLVAPNAINSVPGSSLAEALASTALATYSEITDPLDKKLFSTGLAAAAEVGSRGYFAARCMPNQ